MIRVRFHLAKGKHFMHWQITHHDGRVTYHDPNTCTLTIWQGRLRNQPGTAARIHCGADKTVCAWVEAERVDVDPGVSCVMGGVHAAYNPRVAPHWVIDGLNADGRRFPVLTTAGNRVFVPSMAVA
jgi:succinate dehydrogenase/fumarate reductase flavoprotein subunit